MLITSFLTLLTWDAYFRSFNTGNAKPCELLLCVELISSTKRVALSASGLSGARGRIRFKYPSDLRTRIGARIRTFYPYHSIPLTQSFIIFSPTCVEASTTGSQTLLTYSLFANKQRDCPFTMSLRAIVELRAKMTWICIWIFIQKYSWHGNIYALSAKWSMDISDAIGWLSIYNLRDEIKSMILCSNINIM